MIDIGGEIHIPRSTAHTLRHTFATHSVKKGTKLDVVRKALGHASLAANEAVDRLHTVRLAEAKDEECERIRRQHRELFLTLAAILHEAQFGPPSPAPTGLRLVRRDPNSPRNP